MLMAVGVGLTIINTRAVLEALFGVQTSFARTPKYAIGDRPVNLEVEEVPAPQRLAAVRRDRGAARYFRGDDRVRRRRLTISSPFRSWRCSCSATAGPVSARLYQEQQGRLRWLKQQKLALSGAARQG